MNNLTTISKIWSARKSYALLAPFGILFMIFTVIPVLYAMFNSFTYYNLLDKPRLVSFDNYIRLFTDDDVFLIALKNTLIFASIIGPGSFVLSFGIGWMLNDLSNRIRPIFVLIFYSPAIAGSVFVIFAVLFSGDDYGYMNGLLIQYGLTRDPIQWLVDPKYLPSIVILCSLWSSMGVGFLGFVAGFKTIDKQYYEAGAIDGIKNRWQELWFVTLPLMKPQLMFGAVMSITGCFSVGAVSVALAGYPSTDYSAQTVVNHLSDYGYIRFEMGYASAIAVVLFLLMVGTNKAVNHLLRSVGN